MAREKMDTLSEMILFLAGVTSEEVEVMRVGLPEGLDRAGFIAWMKENEATVRTMYSGLNKTGKCLANLGMMELAFPIAMGIAKLQHAMREAEITV